MGNLATWIGSLGVALLLIAFALNIVGRLSVQGRTYLIMNIVGALLAAYYAWKGGAVPFVILEIVWASAAVYRLISPNKKAPTL